MPVRGLQRADVHAQTQRDGRTDLSGVQLLPFDLAALENVGGEGFEDGLPAQVQSQRLHVPNRAALTVTYRSEELGQLFRAPVKPGPVVELVDIHTPHVLRRKGCLFSAAVLVSNASIVGLYLQPFRW
jgi:hypothetical protein